MQILIVRLSALTLSSIVNKFFSANYEDTSHSDIRVLPSTGKHSSETRDSGELP